MNNLARKTTERYREISAQEIVRYAVLSLAGINLAVIFREFSAVIMTPLIFPGLIMLPGLLSALVLRIKTKSGLDFLLYAFGIGIAFWILGGLFLNWSLPMAGMMRPLDFAPVLAFFNTAILLLIWRIRKKEHSFVLDTTNSRISFSDLKMISIPLMFIFLSMLGSELLNRSNLAGGAIIAIMILFIAIYAFQIIRAKRSPRDGIYAWGIWCASLALLLMYSMRSWHLLGWDVNLEYQVFQATLENGYWNPNQAGNREYNTCLSITILPTMLANLLPAYSEYIYKFTFQLFFSTMPVIVFALSRRYFSKNKSFLAAFLFFAQTWFYEQMPALIRQEIALIFFGLALMTIFDLRLDRKKQTFLFLVFSLAIVLSHYSTSYIWLAIFFLHLITFTALRYIFPSLRETPRRLTLKLFIVSAAFLFLWNGVITSAGNALANFAKEVPSRASEAFSVETLKISIMRMSFSAPALNTEENLLKKYNDITASSRSQYIDLYAESTYEGYIPEVIYTQGVWKPLLPPAFSGPVLTISRMSKLLAVIAFTLIGLSFILLSFRKRRAKSISEFTALGVATLPLILAIVFLPLFNVSYNISRLFMQVYIVLAPASVIGGIVTFRFLSGKKTSLAYSAAIFCLFFLYSTGFMERIFGGPMRITMHNQEYAYEPCYIYDSEVASAKWLDENNKSLSPVYADPLASLRIHAFTRFNENIRYELFPSYISKDGYVYMSKINTNYDVAYTSYNHNLIGYNQPVEFLEENKNLVYSNGESKIYR